MVETEVGYGGWRKHTSGGLSDTFQTTGRQSDFRSNHRRVICNYPLFYLMEMLRFIELFNVDLKSMTQFLKYIAV